MFQKEPAAQILVEEFSSTQKMEAAHFSKLIFRLHGITAQKTVISLP
jgi:hypothetical protein